MTKGEILCRLHDIINWVNTLDIQDNDKLDSETAKDLIDLLVNLISVCQGKLVK